MLMLPSGLVLLIKTTGVPQYRIAGEISWCVILRFRLSKTRTLLDCQTWTLVLLQKTTSKSPRRLWSLYLRYLYEVVLDPSTL